MFARSLVSVAPVLALVLGLSACKFGDGKDGSKPEDGSGTPDVDAPATAAPFFLPTGEPDNTAAPTVEVDAAGGTHTVYPAYAGGRAYYAYCAPGCAGRDDLTVVPFATDATVANAMIALDAEGRPQVLLADFQKVWYAAPVGDFRDPANWRISAILDHHGDKEISGEAFALDPQGRPRFLVHTYVAYLGIGQKAPATEYATCDVDCGDGANWSFHRASDQIWQGSQLRFDANGAAHVATVAHVVDAEGGTTLLGAYLRCDEGCEDAANWQGAGLLPACTSEYEAVAIQPTIALALTRAGEPRIAQLAQQEGAKNVVYFACDAGCTDAAAWSGTLLSDHERIGAGLDLALDADDHPRIAYTLDYNIGVLHCEGSKLCTEADVGWDLAKVEFGGEMDPDTIFLWPNCNVGAWFLHDPSIAIDAAGGLRVGYQARDISGGWSNPDPTKPRCEAGTDMTWSRLALLGAI